MEDIRDYLVKIDNIETYLDELSRIKDRVTIVLSVRDTPGSNMPQVVLGKLRELGFSKFSTELWRMYVGILHNGNPILDYSANELEEKIEVDVNVDDIPIRILSAAWRNGNRASIVINRIDFSCNRRGINIVVYDTNLDIPIDSVYYDSHEKIGYFSRDNKIVEKKMWIESNRKYDVCVVGFWYGANYGSLLNGYAIYRILKSFNKSVIMLNKPDCIVDDRELATWTHNTKFVNSVYPKEAFSPRMSIEDITLINEHVETFLAGSDQIWNYSVSFDGFMYLPFVHNNKRRISFCTSFGDTNDNVNNEEYQYVYNELHRYDAISVREEFGKENLKNKYQLDSEVLLEPVFNVEKTVYEDLISKSTFNESEPYILAYILDPTDEKLNAILKIKEYLNCKIITIPDGYYSIIKNSWENYENKNKFPNIQINMDAKDFLKAFSDAEFVITDSFHGTCFSIIFERKFISISNGVRGRERFNDILGRFNLLERLIYDISNFSWNQKYLNEINYKSINNIIEEGRKQSIEWIKKSLELPINDKKTITPNIKTTSSRNLKLISNEDKEKVTKYSNLCKIISKNIGNRKLILCGKNNEAEKEIYERCGICVEYYFTLDGSRSKEKNTICQSEIYGKSDQYYAVILLNWNQNDYSQMFKSGYQEYQDFIFLSPNPKVIRSGTELKHYEDYYGNEFNTKSPVNVRFKGKNASVKIGENVNLLNNLVIEVGDNSEIIIDDNVTILNPIIRVCNNSKLVISKNVSIGNFYLCINDFGYVSIGSGTTIQNGRLQTGRNKRVEIGRDCMFSWDIVILPHDGHLIYDLKKQSFINNTIGEIEESIIIGDHCWIGGESIIMPNTCIGTGSILGYRCLAKGKYPNNCIIVGQPGKIVKKDVAWMRRDVSYNDEDILIIDEAYRKLTQ